jgi:signal transduction histidine kinase/CheY-like chemotaxis protein
MHDLTHTNNTSTRKSAEPDQNRVKLTIYRAQIFALYQQIPIVLAYDLVNAAVVAIVFSQKIVRTQYIVFLMLIGTVSVIRATGWYLWFVKKIPGSTANWAFLATIGSGLSGILWGYLSIRLFPENILEQSVLAFIIGGMCISPLVSFTYYLPAFLFYVVPATSLLAAQFFLAKGSENVLMGDVILVFVAAITLAACNSNRTFKNLLRLNFDLKERTSELSAANTLLQTEITHRKVTEAQLLQAQKMEAIGRLTGGVAHDFNNLLTSVIGHLDMASKVVADDPRAIPLLRAASHAAERGATLTRQLLAFSRSQHLDAKPVDVSAVLDGVGKILKGSIGPNIRLITTAEIDLAPAWVDPNQLELAILNLALNARDAMPNGGTLKIHARHRLVQPEASSRGLTSGEYVMVSVEDNGTGMDKETVARACEPFFTLKEAGSGSGLGLSMVDGFAAQSGGSMTITSVLGKGTRVDLWLPRAEGGAIECGTLKLDRPVSDFRGERILVCDDDDDVRAFVVNALRASGFTVLVADCGASAVEIIQEDHPIDLLLVDYSMPKMNGVAVIDCSRVYRPALKAILMTGHTEIPRSGRIGTLPLITKPFKIADLERQIAEVLSDSLADSSVDPVPPQAAPHH